MNIYKLHLALIGIVICTLCSCSDEPEPMTSREVVLNLSPCINTEAEVSRAYPAVFANGGIIPANNSKNLNFGIWLCADDKNTYEPYAAGMANMECNYDMSVSPYRWTFKYGGESHRILSVKPQGVGYDDIYLYSYFPYNSKVVSPEAIPVYSGKDELIYAPRLHKQAKQSRDTLNIPLKFKHAQACIEFRIVPTHSHAGLVLYSIKIEDLYSENPILPQSTLFDIVNETYNNQDIQFCRSIELTGVNKVLPVYNADSEKMTAYVAIIPFNGYKDNRFKVTFNISSKICTFTLPAINPDNNGYMDFQAGYKYVYNLTLDNEMIFKSGEIIESNWSDGPDTDIDI